MGMLDAHSLLDSLTMASDTSAVPTDLVLRRATTQAGGYVDVVVRAGVVDAVVPAGTADVAPG